MESTIVDKNPNISTNAYGSESFFQSQTLPSPIISGKVPIGFKGYRAKLIRL